MRETKYRAWDIENKRMLYNVGFSFNDCGMMIELERPMMSGKGVFFTFPIEDFILMQFTGLKDKAGKEIYEGDIVKNHWYAYSCNFIGTFWVVKYGMHRVEGNDYYSNSGEGFYYDATGIDNETYNIANLPCDEDKGIEIIGNIHENQELLKEKSITTSLLNEIEDIPYAKEFAKQIDADFKTDVKKEKF